MGTGHERDGAGRTAGCQGPTHHTPSVGLTQRCRLAPLTRKERGPPTWAQPSPPVSYSSVYTCAHTRSPHAHIHMHTHTCEPCRCRKFTAQTSSRQAKCVPPQAPSGFSPGPACCPRPLLASGLPVAQLGMAPGSIPQTPARQPLLPAQSPDSSLPLPPEPKYGPNHRQGKG